MTVFNPLYENVYDKQPNTIQPFGLPSNYTFWKFWYKFGWHSTYCNSWKPSMVKSNSQLETFWTLQVRVVILDDGLYLATWYTMDGLNRKRYIRNPIWIESTILHFCNKRRLHPDPELKLYNSPIKIVSETKFLGLLFDSKLTFLPHIKMLKNKSLKAGVSSKFISEFSKCVFTRSPKGWIVLGCLS
jgi:hypothetical protein